MAVWNVAPPDAYEEFRDGASYLIPEGAYKKFVEGNPKVGDPSGQFVTTSATMDKVITEAEGDISAAKRSLGIPDQYWNEPLLRIDIPSPLLSNARLPSGFERGANEFFRWGGYTLGGLREAVIDPVPANRIIVSPTGLKPRK